jgi:chromate transporter
LFVAGASFIFPAVIITGIFAWLYAEYGQLPSVEPFVFGIKPAVLAIIASAIIKLGKKALKGWELGILSGLVLTVSLLGVNEILALLTAGVAGALYFYKKSKVINGLKSFIPIVLFQLPAAAAVNISTVKIFWSFLKVGAVLYGSGYVLFAYLDSELVMHGWITRQLLIDAVAIGQFTPGPVLSTATFIGYQMGGIWGALVATIGIFLPSFIFVLFLKPLIPKMRESKLLGYFLDSVNIAAVAVILAVLINMSITAITDWRAVIIATISVITVFVFKKVNAVWIVFGSAVLGYLLSLI